MSDNTKNSHVEHAESRGMQQFWYAWNADMVLGSMTCARVEGWGRGEGGCRQQRFNTSRPPAHTVFIMNLSIRPWFP